MGKIISFLKKNNRYKHLIGGLIVGLLAFGVYPALYAAGVAGACLELKDTLGLDRLPYHPVRKWSRSSVLAYILTEFHLKRQIMCEFTVCKAVSLNSIGRVVYRGYNNANANGGVSYANANNDATNANAYVSSRLDNQQSAYITGNVFPSRCREGQASATLSARKKAGTSSVE